MNRAQSGQVLPLIAVCLAVLMGFGGIGVDVGYLEYRQQAQQSATDAAALGGAQQLVRESCSNPSAAKAAAFEDAASNGFPNGGNVTVTPVNPPAGGPFAGNACAVSVSIGTAHVATFFSRLFGYPGGMNESTQAVAVVSSSAGGCIYLLSPTVSSNFTGDNVNATQCGILINDTANFNSATVAAMSIGYAGAAPSETGATFTIASPAKMLPVANPCPEIPGCAYLTANPPPQTDCGAGGANGYQGLLPSGCYSSLQLNKANVQLSGLYILTGSSNFNGATITGSGVTIYVTATATPPNFNGVSSMTLSPPSSGNYSGVLYYQVPNNSASPNFNGSTENLSGLIYAPSATTVNFNGADGGYLVLVFGSANVSSATAQDFATPPPTGSLVNQAVLAQ